MQIEKRIFIGDLPALEREVGWKNAKRADQVSVPVTDELGTFRDKSEYADLVVVQHAIALMDRARGKIAAVLRDTVDTKDGSARLTTGGSILLSHSPETDPQAILDAKVEHDGVGLNFPDVGPAMVGMNDQTGRYIFLTHGVQVAVERILRAKGKDTLRFMEADEVEALLQGKEMELAMLRMLMEETNA